MNDEPFLLYKTCTIRLLSFRSEGQWVPHALVVRATEREEEGHPVTGDWDHPLPTKEAADAVAKELAMDLIDSQCEHGYHWRVWAVCILPVPMSAVFAATE